MKLTINKVLVVIAIVAVFLWYMRSEQNISTIDESVTYKESQLHQGLEAPSTDPLTSNASTIKTLVISNKSLENQLKEKEIRIKHLADQVESIKRNQSNSDTALVTQLQMELKKLVADQKNLLKEFDLVKSQQSSSTNHTDGMVDEGIMPANVTPIEQQNQPNSLIEGFVQPAIDNALNTMNDTQNDIPIIDSLSPFESGDDMVWIKQSDITEIEVEKGKTEIRYAKTFDSNTTEENDINSDNLHRGFDTDTQAVLDKANEIENDGIPIYTIPPNATFFGTVGMSAIIGRVPVDNTLENAFRFKVLVGSDNLASNGHYIPNLESMSLTGYAEGDYTLECARGTVDTALFTFNDGTVRVVKGEALAHISDEAGVPCIAGQYITNFPDYAAKTAGLSALSSIASSFSDAASTTSTSTEGITTTVVNDAATNAVADGVESASDELSSYVEERQSSAFDVVFIKTGAKLVVEIDDFINIDYEPDGRKLYHRKNAEEYKL